MLYGLYLSASGMQAQEKRQDVIANNLANVNTTGFKRDLALVQARPSAPYEDFTMAQYRSELLARQGGGVLVKGGGIDLSQATLKTTGTATDVALQGPGFFTLQSDASGQPALTRDGSFLVNSEGTLVTANSGRPVLGADGQPIKLDPALPVQIDSAGKISQGDPANGIQLKLQDVSDPHQIVKLGGNILTVNDPAALTPISPNTIVRSGQLEESGVDPIVEMVNMMEGQRAFDANAKMITFQDQTLQDINGVGKVA